MNIVVEKGRIGKDIELRRTNSGVSVCSFPIAVDGANKKTDWFTVVAYRDTAEFIAKYFGKGRAILVEGHLATRSWEDKGGNKRTSVEIIADHIDFADSKSDNTKAKQEMPEQFTEVEDGGDLPF